jgi:dienelactone hydrolase
MNPRLVLSLFLGHCIFSLPAFAANPWAIPDPILARYFEVETEKIERSCLAEIKMLEDWLARRDQYREQLFEMLSLSPRPPRSDLQPVITGKIEKDTFVVEKLHFQSMPGLYVTANLYLPKQIEKPLPAVLYVCGHGPVVKNGISYGNKVTYHHHGVWFARHGYACLIIDTIQLGEIEGLHHGTNREGMWWWNSRGYTPAGVEAWNSIRALDYLVTRPEVDQARLGVTGRSGGGAYSWWLAALDDRVKAAAPVAGITDLQNHVVDGAVEGHCDCMYTVNTYRWDYAQVAALVAPRPLLICNSDKDSIFPLDGVMRIHQHVARIYRLMGASTNLGVLITEGPHKDTQDLQLPVFRWFNKHLKGEDPIIEMAATKCLQPEELKVFADLPKDERVRTIHHTFVPAAGPAPVPSTREAWHAQRDQWRMALKEKVFRGWPAAAGSLDLKMERVGEKDGIAIERWQMQSQPHVPLTMLLLKPAHGNFKQLRFEVKDLDVGSAIFQRFGEFIGHHLQPESTKPESTSKTVPIEIDGYLNRVRIDATAVAVLIPRGSFSAPATRKQNHEVRRYLLLGQTLDGMRVWDIRRGLAALRENSVTSKVPVTLAADQTMAVNALYAAVFEPTLARIELMRLPLSHEPPLSSKTEKVSWRVPDYLNVLRVLDIPEAVALAADHVPVALFNPDRHPDRWKLPETIGDTFGKGVELHFGAH